MKILRIYKETRTVVEIGSSFTTNPAEWPNEFKLVKRIHLGDKERTMIEDFREPTLAEQALWED